MKGLRQSNKGFTLVEICVAIVIFTILVSTAVFGLVQWQEFSIRRQQDENAELVYMAAKSKIAKLKANNALDEQNGWAQGTKVPSTVSSEYTNKTVYTAYCQTHDDYENYKSGTLGNSSAKLLFDLISDSIYDQSVLDACISIEYLEDGTIMAVYYSNRCEKFSYNGAAVDLAQRTEETLEENMVGYYIAY